MSLIFLEKSDIISINKKMTSLYGGLFLSPNNLKNEGQLDYLIEIVQTVMFGEELYPEINQKAALYMYQIIQGHVFHDGNKRTGLEASILFIELNNYNLNQNTSDEDLIEFAFNVAEGSLTFEQINELFLKKIILPPF